MEIEREAELTVSMAGPDHFELAVVHPDGSIGESVRVSLQHLDLLREPRPGDEDE